LLLAHLVAISKLQGVEIIIARFAWLKFALGFLILFNGKLYCHEHAEFNFDVEFFLECS